MTAKDTALTESQIAERLPSLDGWSHAGGVIQRVFKTSGFPATLMLVNAIGYLAEAADHHPDMLVKWGSVAVMLSTHSAGGITDKDFALARQINDLAAAT
jgi:4a-hydroxytetrahydrobiopterin dehydratase